MKKKELSCESFIFIIDSKTACFRLFQINVESGDLLFGVAHGGFVMVCVETKSNSLLQWTLYIKNMDITNSFQQKLFSGPNVQNF